MLLVPSVCLLTLPMDVTPSPVMHVHLVPLDKRRRKNCPHGCKTMAQRHVYHDSNISGGRRRVEQDATT